MEVLYAINKKSIDCEYYIVYMVVSYAKIIKKTTYSLPFFDRFDDFDAAVTKDDVLLSVELSLQDLLSKFIHEVLSLGTYDQDRLGWIAALTEFWMKHETRLMNLRIINIIKSDNNSIVRLQCSGILYYDQSNIVMKIGYGQI